MAPGGGPGSQNKLLVGPRAPPEAKSLSISGSRGGPRRALGGLRGGIFGLFSVTRRGEPKNKEKHPKTRFFLLVECFLYIYFLVLFGFLVAAPAGEWTLKNN